MFSIMFFAYNFDATYIVSVMSSGAFRLDFSTPSGLFLSDRREFLEKE